MSSLKDIMDVDVEPLQSQAYRRNKEAAQQQASFRPSITTSTEVTSPTDEEEDSFHAHSREHPIKRRRSQRASTALQDVKHFELPGQSNSNSAAGQDMDSYSNYSGAMGTGSASGSGTPQHMSRASDTGSDIPVKYTPVTGRISRAKKGVPVHTCDICRPAKTFTRAEHLRRHQLSHQKPAHGCTFENCERAFHRPDLLARHMQRHETQGEKAYVSGDRSREPSSASESQPLVIKTEAPGQRFGSAPDSGADSSTPRTTMTMSSTSTITQPIFSNVNYSPGSAGSHKRNAREAQLTDMDSYPVASPSSRHTGSFDQLLSHTGGFTAADLPVGNMYSRPNSGFDIYSTGGEAFTANYTTAGSPLSNSGLPLLRIPDEPYPSHQTYTQDNSPWCSSSASDSTFSNQSEPSRRGHWVPRGRSGSIADWPVSAAASQWSPQVGTPQDIHSPPLNFMDQYDERLNAPISLAQHLDVPNSYGRYLMESVGTPTPSTNSKPISQVFSAAPRIPNAGLAIANASREKEQLATFSCAPTIPEYQDQALALYINSYWLDFHPLFPFIHRPTYNTVEGSLLTTAIAAIGTQYHDTPEARIRGTEMNELCRRGIDQCLNWSLEIMQAILLTEIFSRFRGRKTTVKLSRRFEGLCQRLLTRDDPTYQAPVGSTPSGITSVQELRDRFDLLDGTQPIEQAGSAAQWFEWVQEESKQRLLSACFIFDIHQALYHQQPRSKALAAQSQAFLTLPCLDGLWDASDASQWHELYTNYAGTPIMQVPDQSLLSKDLKRVSSPFSQSLLVCFWATRLPLDGPPTSPNPIRSLPLDDNIQDHIGTLTTTPLAQTYLALHYTPLHDLLAVAADTWIFSRKITPPQAFQDAQKRLQAWSKTFNAAQATYHACQVLSLSLGQPSKHSSFCHTNALVCMSEYWSLYVAALICWAFGHRYQIVNKSGQSTRRISTTAAGPENSDETVQNHANTYINGMLAMGVEEMLQSRNPIKGETSGVLEVVGLRLKTEGAHVGGRCSMLVDCISVLRKLSKSGNAKWF